MHRYATSPPPASRDRLMWTTAITALGITFLVMYFPAVRFAYHSPGFHVVLETIASLVAGLAAFLFFGRLRESNSRSGRALVYALMVSALVNLFLSVLPTLSEIRVIEHYGAWASLVGRLVGSIAFAIAAFASPVPGRHKRFIGWSISAAAIGTVLFVSVIVVAALPMLPTAVVEGNLRDAALRAHPSVIVLQGFTLLFFAAATVGFVLRAKATGDELMLWLASGSLLAAFARLHYMLYPSLYADWVYTGDFLRLGFYSMLVAGAIGEIRRYWYNLAAAAAAAERRRLARDLHDGVAQELAYIVSQTRLMGRGAPPAAEDVRVIAGAAARALDESRRAIAALINEDDEPLEVALAQAAEEVAQRVGATIRLDLEPGADVSAPAREALIRIAREAISNAGRHSQGKLVSVQLSVNGRVRLAVRDDGVGFDMDERRPDCFGLISMRERAESLDAEFSITSSPGQGTSVEVAL